MERDGHELPAAIEPEDAPEPDGVLKLAFLKVR
jgi:hypothetical protein